MTELDIYQYKYLKYKHKYLELIGNKVGGKFGDIMWQGLREIDEKSKKADAKSLWVDMSENTQMKIEEDLKKNVSINPLKVTIKGRPDLIILNVRKIQIVKREEGGIWQKRDEKRGGWTECDAKESETLNNPKTSLTPEKLTSDGPSFYIKSSMLSSEHLRKIKLL